MESPAPYHQVPRPSTVQDTVEDTGDDDYADEHELLMHTVHTLPKNIKKFWGKRYKLFSRYDYGVYMTAEMWYSVTPEAAAIMVARLVKHWLPNATSILDVCCGAGGNTIQFAKEFDTVGAIDISGTNVECTLHNSQIYGVYDRIWLFTGDWNVMSKNASQDWIPEPIQNENTDEIFDFVFCSPPWGGTSYNRQEGGFDLLGMQPLPVDTLLAQIKQYTKNIGLFLPRNLNIDQIRKITRDLWGSDARSRVLKVVTESHTLGLMVFFGEAVTRDNDIDFENLQR